LTRNTRKPDPDANVPFRKVGVGRGGSPVKAGNGKIVVVYRHELPVDGYGLSLDETDAVHRCLLCELASVSVLQRTGRDRIQECDPDLGALRRGLALHHDARAGRRSQSVAADHEALLGLAADLAHDGVVAVANQQRDLGGAGPGWHPPEIPGEEAHLIG
jgi:hypothetical protein